MKKMQRPLTLLVFTVLLLLCGCVKLWQKNLDIRTYLVDVERTGPPAEQVMAEKLWIEKVHVLPPFNIRNIILRKSDVEYQSSYYTELLMSPSENFRNVFYAWFADSKLFENVTIVDRQGMSHRLVVTVTEFYGDTVDLKAALKIKVTLFDEQKPGMNVLFSNDYEQRVPIGETDASHLMRGYNSALTKILEQCEQDVAEALQ